MKSLGADSDKEERWQLSLSTGRPQPDGYRLWCSKFNRSRHIFSALNAQLNKGPNSSQNILRPRQLPLALSFPGLPAACLWGFLVCCTFIHPPSLALLSPSPLLGSLSPCGGMPGMAAGCGGVRGYLRCWEAGGAAGKGVLPGLPGCRGGTGELVPLRRPSEELREVALCEAFLPLPADLSLSEGVSEAVLEALLPFEFKCRFERFLIKLCDRGEEFLEWLMDVSW